MSPEERTIAAHDVEVYAAMIDYKDEQIKRVFDCLKENGYVNPEPHQIPRKVLPIVERAVSTMIRSASLNELMRIYQFAERDNIDFNYAGIPDDFSFGSKEVFDPKEMNALFEIGYQRVRDGDLWQKAPGETR